MTLNDLLIEEKITREELEQYNYELIENHIDGTRTFKKDNVMYLLYRGKKGIYRVLNRWKIEEPYQGDNPIFGTKGIKVYND